MVSPTIDSVRRWFWSNWLLLFLLSACVVRLWFMLLTGSFWTDETGTAFVVRLAGDASLDAAPQVPMSIYYALPRAAEKLFGFSEISYRIPSVLLMGLAFFFIARLTARLIDPAAAWFSVFVCFAMTDFNYFAVDARPYALGICVTAAAMYFLIRWLDTARWTHAVVFLFLAALLWRVQLAFWAFYPVFPIYTAARLLRRSTKVGWLRALVVYCLLIAALLPVAFQALHLLKTAGAHVIFTVPGPRTFVHNVTWKPFAWGVGFVLVSVLCLKWPRNKAPDFESHTLIGLWWLFMPVCLWTYSNVSGTSLFVPRYFSIALPGAALVTIALVALYVPRKRWRTTAAVMGVVALVTTGHWSVMWPNHSPDDWRDGALAEHRLALEPDTPVVAVSPFVEAQPPVWKPDYYLPGFLYAPLFVYPLRGAVYPFPFVLSPESEAWGAKLIRDTLLRHSRFIVYGGGRFALHWVVWFASQPQLAGWSYQVNRADAINTVVFEKPRAH